jgi:hypothetical protein
LDASKQAFGESNCTKTREPYNLLIAMFISFSDVLKVYYQCSSFE